MSSAFVFDLDGTLIDRERSLEGFAPLQYRRFSAARVPQGRDPQGEVAFTRRLLELDAGGYGDKSGMYEELRREFDLRASVEDLVDDFRSNCFSSVHCFPRAKLVLHTLRERGCLLAIVTNGSEATQQTKLARSELNEMVDVTLISQTVGLRKPNPEIFRLAARWLDIEAEACTFVGDDPERDILGAASAGMTTAWLEHGRSWPDHLLPAPDLRLASLEDLLRETD